MNRVAVYSHNSGLQPLLAPALARDFSVTSTSEADAILELIKSDSVDVLLSDIDLAKVTAAQYFDLHREVSSAGIPVVALVADEDRAFSAELLQGGAHACQRKPPSLRELKVTLERSSEFGIMKRQLSRGKNTRPHPRADSACDGLIGSSEPMRNVCNLVHRVANLNASVLITGETGTGKELIARAIHDCGTRNNQPFVAVSCGAIPETLIESELFGHEKGAFTGSTGAHTGYFEQAGSGTLLLDEIGELSLQTQVKLLRVLQQREFTRLGGSRTIPLRARVLFATHRDLSRMVVERTFRHDLFYRINVMQIHAPAVCERPEDIPELSAHFLKMYSEQYEKSVSRVSALTLQIFREYEWPGNVRELENAIQSAIIHTEAEEIHPADLPETLRATDVLPENEDLIEAGKFERLLRDFKVRLALKALEDYRGNKTMAARSLNISRAYLYRLISQRDDARTA